MPPFAELTTLVVWCLLMLAGVVVCDALDDGSEMAAEPEPPWEERN